MGQYDFACNSGVDLLEDTKSSKKYRIYCYWKNNGWRYNMGPVYGWVSFNGTEVQVFNGNINFQDNNANNLLGYYDFTILKGKAEVKPEYHARLQSNSSYIQGTRTSGSGTVTVEALTHTVLKYNANGGSGAPGNQDKWYGTELHIPSTVPTKTGYTFDYWVASNDSSHWQPGANYTPDPGGTVTFTAHWTALTYTVSYNANGGSGAPSNQTKTYGVNLTLSSTKPTRSGYNFKGWATSATGNVQYASGATYSNNAAVTLYAVWELAYWKPKITNFMATRCTSNGTASESGTYLKYTCNWTTYNNVTKVRCEWKVHTSSTWTGSDITASGKSGNVSTVLGSGGISVESSYDARIYVTDSGGTTYSSELTIGTVSFPIDVKAGGKGVAFGKVAETENLFDVGYDANFNKKVVINGQRVERKLAIAGRQDASGSNWYYKFASTRLTELAWNDRYITFLVHGGYADKTNLCGILTAHVRTNGNKVIESATLEWEYAGPEVKPGYFKIFYSPTATTQDVELWCYAETGHQQIHFDVISEGTRTSGNDFGLWTVYKNVASSGTALPTSGVTILNSNIKNGMGGGKVLYNSDTNGTTGTTANITLAETAANFKYIEIFYSLDNASSDSTHYANYKSVKVFLPNGKKVGLEGITYHALSSSNIMQLTYLTVTISGTTITRNSEVQLNLTPHQELPSYGTEKKVKIYRVIGYR